MQQLTDFSMLFHDRNERGRKILGVRGHESQPKIPIHGSGEIEQLRKRRVAVAIRIHVLPQQRDFAVALFDECFDLFQHVFLFARTLPPAHVGYDTIGAEIVTAVRNIHPGVGKARPHGQNPVLRFRTLFGNGNHRLFPFPFFFDQPTELGQIMGAEQNVDKRKLILQHRRLAFFLHHAPAHGDNQVLLLPL